MLACFQLGAFFGAGVILSIFGLSLQIFVNVGLVGSCHGQYGVLIVFECHFNLGDTLGSWGKSGHVEFTKDVVVISESFFACFRHFGAHV